MDLNIKDPVGKKHRVVFEILCPEEADE